LPTLLLFPSRRLSSASRARVKHAQQDMLPYLRRKCRFLLRSTPQFPSLDVALAGPLYLLTAVPPVQDRLHNHFMPRIQTSLPCADHPSFYVSFPCSIASPKTSRPGAYPDRPLRGKKRQHFFLFSQPTAPFSQIFWEFFFFCKPRAGLVRVRLQHRTQSVFYTWHSPLTKPE